MADPTSGTWGQVGRGATTDTFFVVRRGFGEAAGGRLTAMARGLGLGAGRGVAMGLAVELVVGDGVGLAG
jgi:hypothetical protein